MTYYSTFPNFNFGLRINFVNGETYVLCLTGLTANVAAYVLIIYNTNLIIAQVRQR